MKKSPWLLVIGTIALIYAAAFAYLGITENTGSPSQGASSICEILIGILPLLFILLLMIVWIAALINMLRNPAIQGSDKIVWTLIIIFLNVLGALIYFCVAPKPKLRLNVSPQSHEPRSV